jgi:hypothetical protein
MPALSAPSSCMCSVREGVTDSPVFLASCRPEETGNSGNNDHTGVGGAHRCAGMKGPSTICCHGEARAGQLLRAKDMAVLLGVCNARQQVTGPSPPIGARSASARHPRCDRLRNSSPKRQQRGKSSTPPLSHSQRQSHLPPSGDRWSTCRRGWKPCRWGRPPPRAATEARRDKTRQGARKGGPGYDEAGAAEKRGMRVSPQGVVRFSRPSALVVASAMTTASSGLHAQTLRESCAVVDPLASFAGSLMRGRMPLHAARTSDSVTCGSGKHGKQRR